MRYCLQSMGALIELTDVVMDNYLKHLIDFGTDGHSACALRHKLPQVLMSIK